MAIGKDVAVQRIEPGVTRLMVFERVKKWQSFLSDHAYTTRNFCVR